MAEDILLAAHGLIRYYGAHQALHGVDLSLRRGEILGLLGRNGAGKSTIMQILTGVLAPHQGTVTLCGIDLAREPVRAKRHSGYLPETPPLYRDARVDEYLDFCAQLHGLDRRQAAQAIIEAKRHCGLEDVGQRLIMNLSKGYQQRVGIAQAILHEPEVLVLDEPTVGLDPVQILEVRSLIRALGKRHAVILSTHILSEVQALCTRAVILQRGRIVYDAPIDTGDRDLLVSLRRTPDCAAFNAIAGVERCVALGPHRFSLTVTDHDTVAERIAAVAVAEDWGLHELRVAEPRLEQVFLEFGEAGTVSA